MTDITIQNISDLPHVTEIRGLSLPMVSPTGGFCVCDIDADTLRGEKGDKGQDGAKGDKGDKGDAFTYADFTPAQLAALKGEKGDKGDPGAGGAADVEAMTEAEITAVCQATAQ